jgi:putative holliday junction resolvase
MPINFLALDVGRARIGLAMANDVARIASPLPAVANNETVIATLQTLVKEYEVAVLVVGLPRNLSGEATEQTTYVENFIADLAAQIDTRIVTQDEAVTSVQAEAELKKRGKPYEKGDIDSLSAVYILEDFIADEVH